MNNILDLIGLEQRRQKETLMLIPSENYASRQVLSALGSVLSNKYSEGYVGRRYYQGNKYVDEIEDLAIQRAKKLFGVNFVNVQPYSGSPANAAAIMAMAEPGETIMGLKLSVWPNLLSRPHIYFPDSISSPHTLQNIC
jgi:glycine hydroxymethyltransferase